MSSEEEIPVPEHGSENDLGVGGDAGQWFDENYTPPRAATEQIQVKTTHPMVYITTLLVLAGLVGGIYYYMSVTEEARRKAAEIDTVLSLEDLSSGLQLSTVPAFLKTLKAQKGALEDLEKRVYAKFPNPDDPTERRYRAEMVADDASFLDGFLNDLIRNIDQAPGSSYWSYRPKEEFRLLVQQTLVSCGSFAANSCIFKLAYTPLMEHVGELHDASQGVPLPWLFVIVDADGVGLADAHDPAWSDRKYFAKNTPILAAALKEKKIGRAPFKHAPTGLTVDAFAFPLIHDGDVVGAALTGILQPADKPVK